MQERNQKDQLQREDAIIKDPSSIWTIETRTRAIEERERTKKVNNEVKQTLDSQVRHIVAGRQQYREDELSTGQQLIEADMSLATREAQLEAFKRHEMTKQLRSAWNQ